MATEIERKFLVAGNHWKQGAGSLLKQGYLNTTAERTVRVRIADQKGYLTIKGKTQGTTRLEYEYEIPLQDAEEMLTTLCEKPLIEKIRYRIPMEEVVYEVDEFMGENSGLIIAEIELLEENQNFPRPDWLGEEVSHDPRYFNSNLIAHPFSQWQK